MVGTVARATSTTASYVGGFSEADILEMLESLESNYLGWSAAMAPAIMDTPDRPALGAELTDELLPDGPGGGPAVRPGDVPDRHPRGAREVSCPTLVLQCSDDLIAPVEVGSYVRDALPDGSMIVLDGHRPLPAPERAGGDHRGDDRLRPCVSRCRSRELHGPMSNERTARQAFLDALVHDDPIQLYERAPCGFLSTTPDGLIVKCNATFRTWIGLQRRRDRRTAVVRRTCSPPAAGSTTRRTSPRCCRCRAAPGRSRSTWSPPTVAACRCWSTRRSTATRPGVPQVIRIAVFDATERRQYERELLRAKEAAEAAEDAGPDPRPDPPADAHPAHPAADPQRWTSPRRTDRPETGDEVGGDFYDVFPVGDEDWIVVIGDVCGKGVDAAVVTSLARHTLRALAVATTARARCWRASTRFSSTRRPTVSARSRCCVCAATTEGWTAVLTTGRAPAAAARPSRRRPVAFGGEGPLVGVMRAAQPSSSEPATAPGDVLVLYTDGITEGRRDGELLRRGAGCSPPWLVAASPASIVEELVTDVLEFQRGAPRDDIAVLAVGVPPA